MTDRVILAVKFTPAGSASQVRRAVGGFLRYVQHRDVHPAQREDRPRPEVAGLLKYVAHRDRASARAELFGPSGSLCSEDRKAFGAYVAHSLEKSNSQLFRGRDGRTHDRRRAVYRFVISPERASGLDLRRLTAAVMCRLEQESGVSGLRWIAAVHRNTAHHHVHLVVAGMCQDACGKYHRVELTKPRLAAMKKALVLEIERQRGDRMTSQRIGSPAVTATRGANQEPALRRPAARPAHIRILPLPAPARPLITGRQRHSSSSSWSLFRLRAAARKYQHDCERDAEEEARRRQWELVA